MKTIEETKPTGTSPAASLPDRSPAAISAAPTSPGVRTTIPYMAVRPDPEQPRKDFPAKEMEELRESIRVNGIQDVLIVRADPDPKAKTKYMLVEGERRWRCAGELKLETLPVEVREFKEDAAVRQYQRIVGTQRLNLSLLEQARDYAAELGVQRKKNPTFSPENLADVLGVSRATMYDRLKLTRLTVPVEKALRAGDISSAHAVVLSQVPTQQLQEEVLEWIAQENASVRDLAAAIKDDYLKPLNGVSFDVREEYAPPTALAEKLPTYGPKSKKLRACEGCPYRTGNMLETYPELKDRPNVCTHVECFKVKLKIGAGLALAKAKADGFETVPPDKYQSNYYTFEKETEKYWGNNGKERKWSEMAAQAKIKPRISVDSEGNVVKVFSREDCAAIKKGCGIKESSYSNGVDLAEIKKYQKQKKEFTATASKATAVILQKLVTKLPDGSVVVPAKVWALLGAAAYHGTDINRHDYVAKRRGLSKSMTESRDALTKLLRGMNEPIEQARFVLEVMLCAAWEGGGWHKCGWDSKFLELCAVAGGTPDKLAGTVKEQELPLPTSVGAKGKPKSLPLIGKMSAQGKARIIAAATARWAKVKAAKKGGAS